MIARANLHDDPLRFVLEYIDGAIGRLEKLHERDPLPEETLNRLCRFASLGSQAAVVEMIRASDRRARWIRTSWWLASLVAAAAAGYLARGL